MSLTRLSEDVLQNVLVSLVGNGMAVLHLAQSSKALWKFIMQNDDLWFSILAAQQNERFAAYFSARNSLLYFQRFRSIPQGLYMSPAPDFYSSAIHFYYTSTYRRGPWPPRQLTADEKTTLAAHARRRVFVQYADRCGLCGTRTKHEPVWNLGKRLCQPCFRDNTICNNMLFLSYGVTFWDLMLLAPEAMEHVFFFKLATYSQNNRYVNCKYVWSHWQDLRFMRNQIKTKTPSVFFWRPHLEQHFNLSAIRKAKTEQTAAIAVVCAKIRALFIRLMLAHRGSVRLVRRNITRKSAYLTETRISDTLRCLLLGQPADNANLTHFKKLTQRIRSRCVIVRDINPSKLLEIIRVHESSRMYDIEPFFIPALQPPRMMANKHPHLREKLDNLLLAY